MSYPNPNWPQQPQQNSPFSPFQQQTGGGFYPPPPQKSGGSWLVVLAFLGAGALLLGVLCCGGIAYVAQPPRVSAAARQPFDYSGVPLPPLPDRPEPDDHIPGVLHYEILLGDEAGGFYDTPGHGGYLYLYLPPGEHAPGSLPCILITAAGSTLLAGMEVVDGDEPEHIPYVQAGYAVLAYELDGPDYTDEDDIRAMREPYEAFRDSRAGLVNARNALEYVLAKVPEVNPKQIYAAGHSSAATHALLFAAHEPRLAGVIAYAPAVDLPKWFGPRLRVFSFFLPGVADFITQSSPSTHIERLKCPTFLFQAEDDSVCELADTKSFADRLKAQGTDVTLVTVPTGDHYDAMIDEGIPGGIGWLREQAKR